MATSRLFITGERPSSSTVRRQSYRRPVLRALCAGVLILAALAHPFEKPSKAAEPSVKFVLGTDAETRAQIAKFTDLRQKTPHTVDAPIARAAANYAMSEIEKGGIDAAEAVRLAPQRWDSW